MNWYDEKKLSNYMLYKNCINLNVSLFNTFKNMIQNI